MKKLILITACLGLTMSCIEVNAVTTSGTKAIGAASAGVLALGGLAHVFSYTADSVGTLIAAGVGSVAWYATDTFLQFLMQNNCCIDAIASNPAVVPVMTGAVAFGLLFWLREQYLPKRIKELEKYGKTLLKIGIGLGTISAASYLLNMCDYQFTPPIKKIDALPVH